MPTPYSFLKPPCTLLLAALHGPVTPQYFHGDLLTSSFRDTPCRTTTGPE